ncbi:hypothetical protein GCM10022241_18840 [Micrococcus endophyticus]
MSIRSGASVCQDLAESSVPRGARMVRDGSCWVKPTAMAVPLDGVRAPPGRVAPVISRIGMHFPNIETVTRLTRKPDPRVPHPLRSLS